MVYGGRLLDSWCGVFWFVTGLFFCQILYHFLFTQWRLRGWRLAAVMGMLYFLAVLNGMYLVRVPFPWSINTVVLTVLFYWAGHLAAQHAAAQRTSVAIGAIGLGLAIVLDTAGIVRFTLDIKAGDYGVPLLSVLLALCCTVLLAQGARLVVRLAGLGDAFIELGRASLVIMFLHAPIHLLMVGYAPLSSTALRVVVALLLPYVLFRIWEHVPLCRALLLGESAGSQTTVIKAAVTAASVLMGQGRALRRRVPERYDQVPY